MDRIKRIIEILKNEMTVFIEPDTPLDADTDIVNDLHVDSLDKVLIIGNIEEEFGVSFDNDQVAEIRTIGDIDALIGKLLSE